MAATEDAQAAGTEGRMVVLSGPSGCGKSSIAARLLEHPRSASASPPRRARRARARSRGATTSSCPRASSASAPRAASSSSTPRSTATCTARCARPMEEATSAKVPPSSCSRSMCRARCSCAGSGRAGPLRVHLATRASRILRRRLRRARNRCARGHRATLEEGRGRATASARSTTTSSSTTTWSAPSTKSAA